MSETTTDHAGLAGELEARPDRVIDSPWAGWEWVRGWGVFGLPFDSGHVLALRVFPENDFAPYRTIWHRDPDERWAIHVDGPRADWACPRYYGAACEEIGHSDIDVTWTGERSLRVTMEQPSLEWTLRVGETRSLRLMNALSARMPTWTWRPRALLAPRERIAGRLFGVGDIKLSGVMPNGQFGILMPQRMYLVEEAHAVLGGVDLGSPVTMYPNPKIGDVPMPARGILAVGQAFFRSPGG